MGNNAHSNPTESMSHESISKKRYVYADFTKLFAMFIVTWGHCSQCLSDDLFPFMFGRQGLFISFHMPLFMMISGFFINPSEIHRKSWIRFVKNKFFRLVVPAMVWYILYCLLTLHKPIFSNLFFFYWFLTSMFLSYCIIGVVCKISRQWVFYIISVICVIIIPGSWILHLNFMYPMIWGGYFLSLIMSNMNEGTKRICVVLLCIMSIFFLWKWDVRNSVYLSPFNVVGASYKMLYALIFRLLTGGVIGSFFIICFERYEKSSLFHKIGGYGKYTLVMYTASFILNGIMSNFLHFYRFSISVPYLLEIASLVWTVIVCTFSIYIAIICMKYSVTKKILMGYF